MDRLVNKRFKNTSDLDRMQELSFLLSFDKMDNNRYALLRSRGASVYARGYEYPVSEKATSANRWNGWVELMNRALDPMSIVHKARLLAETRADILLLQEIEDRESLMRLNKRILPEYPNLNYQSIVVVPGNDLKGVEQGLLLKKGYKIENLCLFTEDKDEYGELIFKRNCLSYEIILPGKERLWILSAQLQDANEDKEKADEQRLKQSKRITELYQAVRKRGIENILVMGTFHAPAYCYSLAPILQETDLKDLCRHPNFQSPMDKSKTEYHRLGAYRKGINMRQQDYILMSPKLFKRVQSAGINRRGIWAGFPSQWVVYPTLKEKRQQASEHPLLWIEVN
ncbi:hypothetical protein [Christiangramia sp.]|uniref:hypothetical protein n=1 Tax=Christiangramia sp. TaxID=1931228 RepID=UPI002623521B|nr:hypothetical protein [Christiangramia sp.]